MNITEVRNIAKSQGITSINLFKNDLIKTIQIKEGNFDCYRTAFNGVCDQSGCCWREDCFEVAHLEK